MHDPAGDPTFEPPQPVTEPTPNPASDPPPEMPGDPLAVGRLGEEGIDRIDFDGRRPERAYEANDLLRSPAT
jgi:hypothetical protein